MADSNIREIQVSAKQLVFLFMASVVLAVAVFLLGVSVGRGVRDRTGVPASASDAPAASASAAAAATTIPPPTEVPPLVYPQLSKADGSTIGAGAKAEAPPVQPPPTDVPDVSEDAPAARETVTITAQNP